MGLGFAIAGLFVATASMFLPLYGFFMSWAALAMATVAAACGWRAFPVATVLISAVVGIPTLVLAGYAQQFAVGRVSGYGIAVVFMALLIAPLIALFIRLAVDGEVELEKEYLHHEDRPEVLTSPHTGVLSHDDQGEGSSGPVAGTRRRQHARLRGFRGSHVRALPKSLAEDCPVGAIA